MLQKQISDLVNQHLAATDKFLVEVLIKPGNRIYVFIDGDHGITIEDCARVSRMLESSLDREEEDFELVVSSAGADQPLRMPRQYIKNTGRCLKIKQMDDSMLTGKLEKVEQDGIMLLTEADKKKKIPQSEIFVRFGDIKEAKVILSFK